MDSSQRKAEPEAVELPVEVEIYIEADGSVTFADLAAEIMPIAFELNPEDPLACPPAQQPADAQVASPAKKNKE